VAEVFEEHVRLEVVLLTTAGGRGESGAI